MPMNRETTWKRYSDAWNASSEEHRLAIFTDSLAKDCRYTDPLASTFGWEALATYMRQFQTQIPGGRFAIRNFATHNHCSIAHWDMLSANGEKLGDGVSYGEFDDNGKITTMTGFYEVPPSP